MCCCALPAPRRCDEAASTLTLLCGLSLLHVSRDAVHLKLMTAYPRGPVAGQDPGPCATADHELSLHLQPASSAGGPPAAAAWRGGAQLSPLCTLLQPCLPACTRWCSDQRAADAA
jgi:hypothetical protein